jgi:hypothetical protein
MRLTPKSKGLLALAALLAVAVAVPVSEDPTLSPLPSLPAIDAASVERIEISLGPLQKIIISANKEEGAIVSSKDRTFSLDAPIQGPADPLLVKALLREFQAETPMDVRVDKGNYDAYGLQNETQIIVELFGVADSPLLSFALGATARGGASFVRLNDDSTVYRARIGPRHRVDRPATEWRDKSVLSLDPNEIIGLHIQTETQDLPFQRSATGGARADGSAVYGVWHLPGHTVDATTVKSLAASLSRIRASEILSETFDAGFDPPAATVTLVPTEGEPIELSFGSRVADKGAFVRIQGRPSTFRVAKSRLSLVQRPLSAYGNLQVLAFDLAQAAKITWEDNGPTRVLQRKEDGVWTVTEPKNTDSDLARIASGLGALSNLRGRTVSEAEIIGDLAQQLTIHFKDGRKVGLSAGHESVDSVGSPWLVQTSSGPEIYELDDQTWSRVRSAFGRGG